MDCGDDFISLDGESCVAGCIDDNDVEVPGPPKRCECAATYFIDIDGDSCTQTCSSSTSLNLQKTECIEVCSDQNAEDNSGECQCPASSSLILSADQDECFNIISTSDQDKAIACSENGQFFDPSSGDNECVSACPVLVDIYNRLCITSCTGGTSNVNFANRCTCPSNTPYWDENDEQCYDDCADSGTPGLNADLAGEFCVVGCDDATPDENEELRAKSGDTPAQCICENSFVKNVDASICVMTCNATLEESLNIAGDQCVAECPEFSEPDETLSPIQCVCSDGYQLSVDEDECLDGCEGGQVESLDGKKCLTDCDSGDASDTENIGGFCECQDGFFPNSDRTMCISDCTGGQVLNLAGDACIDLPCPNGANPLTNDDGKQQCICDDLLNSAETGCTAACSSG